MRTKEFPVELHKKFFLLWASGLTMEQLSRLPEAPKKTTLMSWAKNYPRCSCGWHRWAELKRKLGPDGIAQELEKEGIDLGQVMKQLESPEVVQKLEAFIKQRRSELLPIFRRIQEVFGIKTDGRLTGNLHVDMLVTGYLLVLKVREAVVTIEINDAYQLIQLMRTVVQIFKSWGLPSQPIKHTEEVIEIKLAEADRPTPWKDDFSLDEVEERAGSGL